MIAALALCAALTPPVRVDRRVAAMGTALDVSVVAEDRARGLEASEIVVQEMRRIEDLLTTWRQSPLSRLNDASVNEEVAVGQEIATVLAEVLRWAGRTDRAFDPTVAPLMRAWDLRGAGRVPSPEQLASAVAATGPEHFRIDAARGRAARLNGAAGIDEGAWGKGYALDRAAQRLAQAGVANALIDLGGQTLALGTDDSAGRWTISIAHPRERERPVVALSLTNLSVSTSGNSERGRTIAGRRIGHELTPRTGEPAPDFGSATVIAPSALIADILSTAFFVLGPSKGLALSDRLRREGVAQDVLFLIDRGDHLEAIASPGLLDHVLSADPTIVRGLTTHSPATPSP
ncbi:MAG: FAD:protein FMN transferase [Acidobacteriota bacterium]